MGRSLRAVRVDREACDRWRAPREPHGPEGARGRGRQPGSCSGACSYTVLRPVTRSDPPVCRGTDPCTVTSALVTVQGPESSTSHGGARTSWPSTGACARRAKKCSRPKSVRFSGPWTKPTRSTVRLAGCCSALPYALADAVRRVARRPFRLDMSCHGVLWLPIPGDVRGSGHEDGLPGVAGGQHPGDVPGRCHVEPFPRDTLGKRIGPRPRPGDNHDDFRSRRSPVVSVTPVEPFPTISAVMPSPRGPRECRGDLPPTDRCR
ncbi:hypothetical protein BJY54_006957 [Streptomyces nodosus]|nr:hypothetical protein [Streptomyces nodosus]